MGTAHDRSEAVCRAAIAARPARGWHALAPAGEHNCECDLVDHQRNRATTLRIARVTTSTCRLVSWRRMSASPSRKSAADITSGVPLGTPLSSSLASSSAKVVVVTTAPGLPLTRGRRWCRAARHQQAFPCVQGTGSTAHTAPMVRQAASVLKCGHAGCLAASMSRCATHAADRQRSCRALAAGRSRCSRWNRPRSRTTTASQVRRALLVEDGVVPIFDAVQVFGLCSDQGVSEFSELGADILSTTLGISLISDARPFRAQSKLFSSCLRTE